MSFDTPILLIIFNRPKNTSRVFNEIKKIKPKRLYVAADGPRKTKDGEEEICNATRKLVLENITWDCQVTSLLRDKNLGCKAAVSTAINWFFESEECGIILEDDCVPESSFFNFCQVLLEKYRDEKAVMHIGGTNFLNGQIGLEDSYYFSKLVHVWGWATWRRAWHLYDIEMRDLNTLELDDISSDIKAKNYWTNILRKVKNNKIDTWDYQWQYSIWHNKGMGISPVVNMISNIGFGPDATHTINVGEAVANMQTEAITMIKHPSIMQRNINADNYEMASLVVPHKFFEVQIGRIIKPIKKLFLKK